MIACLGHTVCTWAAEPAFSIRERLCWQIALEHVGFSPGVIDGRIGRKTEWATREFQRVHRLPVTGRLDEQTTSLLRLNPDGALTTYTIQPSDFAEIGEVPEDWIGKSKLHRLGHESLEAAIAEKFHCTQRLLGELNPGFAWGTAKAGDSVTVPNVALGVPAPRGEMIEIDAQEKIIRVYDEANRLVGLFHCSVAADKAKIPAGQARVQVVSNDPTYLFDPAMWPDVRGVNRKLLIPPGPRNPVGRCWIGLSLPGYGIHGTPKPELIGKTGSHGCFRLTNWDAQRLAKMIRIGTPVRFVGR